MINSIDDLKRVVEHRNTIITATAPECGAEFRMVSPPAKMATKFSETDSEDDGATQIKDAICLLAHSIVDSDGHFCLTEDEVGLLPITDITHLATVAVTIGTGEGREKNSELTPV